MTVAINGRIIIMIVKGRKYKFQTWKCSQRTILSSSFFTIDDVTFRLLLLYNLWRSTFNVEFVKWFHFVLLFIYNSAKQQSNDYLFVCVSLCVYVYMIHNVYSIRSSQLMDCHNIELHRKTKARIQSVDWNNEIALFLNRKITLNFHLKL